MSGWLTLREIVAETGLNCLGDDTRTIQHLAYADAATAEDIAVVRSDRELRETQAHVVLTEPRLDPAGRSLLCCMHGELPAAIVAVARCFIAHGEAPDYDAPITYREIACGAYAGERLHLGKNVQLAPHVTIGNDVTIGGGCIIEPDVTIGSGTVLGAHCIVRTGARLGAAAFFHYDAGGRASSAFGGIGRTRVGSNVHIGANAVIQRGALGETVLGDGCCIGNLVLVAHDVRIGAGAHIVCQSGIASETVIGSDAWIMAQAGVRDRVHVGARAIVYAKSGVIKDVPAGTAVSGIYARPHQDHLEMQAALLRQVRKTKDKNT